MNDQLCICVVCGLQFAVEECVNGGSKKYSLWRCKPHHATVRRMEAAANTADEKKALKTLKKDKVAFMKEVIELTEQHSTGQVQKSEIKQCIETLVIELVVGENQRIMWCDEDSYIAWWMYAKAKSRDDALKLLEEAQKDNSKVPQKTFYGKLHYGVWKNPETHANRFTRLHRGVQQSSRMEDSEDAEGRAWDHMKALTDMRFHGNVFKNTGGPDLKPHGDELDDDARKRVSEQDVEGLALLGQKRRKQHPNEVSMWVLRKAEALQNGQDIKQSITSLKRRVANLGRLQTYKDVENDGKFAVTTDNLSKTLDELLNKINECASVGGATLEGLKTMVLNLESTIAEVQGQVDLVEDQFEDVEKILAREKQEKSKMKRVQQKLQRDEGVKNAVALVPDGFPGHVISEMAKVLSGGKEHEHDTLDWKEEEGVQRHVMLPMGFSTPEGHPGDIVVLANIREGKCSAEAIGKRVKRAQTLWQKPEYQRKPGIAFPLKLDPEASPYSRWSPQGFPDEKPLGVGTWSEPWLFVYKKKNTFFSPAAIPMDGLGMFLRVGYGKVLGFFMKHDFLDVKDRGIFQVLKQITPQQHKQGKSNKSLVYFTLDAANTEEWVWCPPGYVCGFIVTSETAAVFSLPTVVKDFVTQVDGYQDIITWNITAIEQRGDKDEKTRLLGFKADAEREFPVGIHEPPSAAAAAQ